jgi:glutathione gamma-glutamylcysteinyltransferase
VDYLQSCRHKGWSSVANYLSADVPHLLKSEDVKDVEEVLSVVFKSPPADLREFIKWVAEVRRQDDGGIILSEEEKGRLSIKVFSWLLNILYFFNLSFPLFPKLHLLET